jgi:hypothetical protein
MEWDHYHPLSFITRYLAEQVANELVFQLHSAIDFPAYRKAVARDLRRPT